MTNIQVFLLLFSKKVINSEIPDGIYEKIPDTNLSNMELYFNNFSQDLDSEISGIIQSVNGNIEDIVTVISSTYFCGMDVDELRRDGILYCLQIHGYI